MSPEVKEPSVIPPNPPRWEPSNDPSNIHVPALDTSAPVNDQIDQIEQLITLKLQNIDANFSKMQHIMSTRLLPAFKRYSVATEPVREAAKFWTSFYEQAAQIRIPTYDDFSAEQEEEASQSEPESERKDAEASTSRSTDPSTTFDPNRTPSESSFMPGQGAVSSTPAAASRQRVQNPHDTFSSQGEPSWSASLESPLVRLDRDLQNFGQENQSVVSASSQTFDETQDQTIHASTIRYEQPPPRLPSASPNKGKSRQQSLREDVLRSAHKAVSPLRFRSKPKTPVPVSRNPYLPEGSKPKDWSGVVDLRDPAVATPPRNLKPFRRRIVTPKAPPADEDDEDDDLLPPGMSPPVMMQFATLPTLGRTPQKQAAARIGQDLLGDARKGQMRPFGGRPVESSMSSVSSPPSISRYTQHHSNASTNSAADSTLDSLLRRVNSLGHRQESSSSSGPISTIPSSNPSYHTSAPGPSTAPPPPPAASTFAPPPPSSLPPSASFAPPPAPSLAPPPVALPVTPDPPYYHYQDEQTPHAQVQDDDSLDFDDFDSDEINNTAHPSAAFLLASRQRPRDSDSDASFGSSNTSSDSFDYVDGGGAPVHPFARGASVSDDFEDSFEEDEGGGAGREGVEVEETVFGVPPAERAARASEAGLGLGPDGRLRMLGRDAEVDTAVLGVPTESPTPWPMGGRGG